MKWNALPAKLDWIQRILTPLARFCLRHAIQIQDFLESVKVAYIRAAEEELRVENDQRVNVSRLSAMTGLHRRDVTRIYERQEIHEEPRGFTARVVGQWLFNPSFSKKRGKPRVLEASGEGNEFSELVSSVSRDLNPSTVLFELERVGAVERIGTKVKLLQSEFIPQSDHHEGFRLLADDIRDLIQCVETNVLELPALPHLHGRTEFDMIPSRYLPEIHEWLLQEGAAFHKKTREFLAQFDADLNPEIQSSEDFTRVAVTTFSYSERKARYL